MTYLIGVTLAGGLVYSLLTSLVSFVIHAEWEG